MAWKLDCLRYHEESVVELKAERHHELALRTLWKQRTLAQADAIDDGRFHVVAVGTKSNPCEFFNTYLAEGLLTLEFKELPDAFHRLGLRPSLSKERALSSVWDMQRS